MTERELLLRLERASKAFGGPPVLDAMDLAVGRGEHVAVLGPSGTGKSVLLKVAIGLLELDEGEVRLFGDPVTRLDDRELAAYRQRMGIVFQAGALFDSMTVFDNVAYPLREVEAVDEDTVAARVEELLHRVHLGEVGGLAPSDLSGGMRKRVAIARTLATRPELILYDEPTTGLDPATGRRISCLIREVARTSDSTSVVVTHDIDCARTVADRWTFLQGGRLLADGTPEDLFSCADPQVRAFLAPWASLMDLSRLRDVDCGEPELETR